MTTEPPTAPPRHIDRIIWKPINWWPESPDEYPDRVPPPSEPESKCAILPNGDVWFVEAQHLAPTMRVMVNWSPQIWRLVAASELEDGESAGQEETGPSCPWAGTWMMELSNRAQTHMAEDGVEFTVFGPGGEDRPVWEIPADKESLLEIVDALLYIQRRTHEHDWQGPDDGLPEEGKDGGSLRG